MFNLNCFISALNCIPFSYKEWEQTEAICLVLSAPVHVWGQDALAWTEFQLYTNPIPNWGQPTLQTKTWHQDSGSPPPPLLPFPAPSPHHTPALSSFRKAKTGCYSQAIHSLFLRSARKNLPRVQTPWQTKQQILLRVLSNVISPEVALSNTCFFPLCVNNRQSRCKTHNRSSLSTQIVWQKLHSTPAIQRTQYVSGSKLS